MYVKDSILMRMVMGVNRGIRSSLLPKAVGICWVHNKMFWRRVGRHQRSMGSASSSVCEENKGRNIPRRWPMRDKYSIPKEWFLVYSFRWPRSLVNYSGFWSSWVSGLGFVGLCKTGNIKLPLGICSLIKIHDVVQVLEILHLYSLYLYHDSSDNTIV